MNSAGPVLGELDGRLMLRVSEVSRLLGWSEEALYLAIARGQIPARRMGRRIVFLRHELDAYLDQLPCAARESIGNGAR